MLEQRTKFKIAPRVKTSIFILFLEKEIEKWKENELQSRILEKREKFSASDPRLLQYIRDYVLIPPVRKDIPYNLSNPKNQHFSQFGEQVAFLNASFGSTVSIRTLLIANDGVSILMRFMFNLRMADFSSKLERTKENIFPIPSGLKGRETGRDF